MSSVFGLHDSYGTITNMFLTIDDLETHERKLKAEEEQKKGCLNRIDKETMKEWVRSEGNYFFFTVYKSLIQDFPECDALLFRFIYLCTYGNYDGYLVATERRFLNKKDLYNLLMLSDKRAEECINEMLSKKLLFLIDNKYKINSKYFIRGKINDQKGNVSRVFNKGLQELYRKSKYNEHKMLAHFIPLLPYVNHNYNIICFNPEETNISKIQALSLKDIAEIFGVDKSNSTRLRKKLVDIKVNGYYLMGYFYRDFGGEELKCFIVNPYVFCKTTKLSDMTNITNLFDLPSNEFKGVY